MNAYLTAHQTSRPDIIQVKETALFLRKYCFVRLNRKSGWVTFTCASEGRSVRCCNSSSWVRRWTKMFQGTVCICLHTPPPLMCLFWCVCASVFAPVRKDAHVCPWPCNIIRVLGLSFNKKLKLVSSLCTHTQVHYWIPTRNPVTCHDTSIAESRWASVATHHFYTFSHCYSCSTHFLS